VQAAIIVPVPTTEPVACDASSELSEDCFSDAAAGFSAEEVSASEADSAAALLAVLPDDALQRFDIYRMPFGADALYQSAGVRPALSVERDADLLGAVP